MRKDSLTLVFACLAGSALAEEPVRGWVVLPVQEYRELRARAYPPEARPEPPPVDATLTRVDYNLRVTSDAAVGEALVTIDVLKDGWVRVPIPAGLKVREARLDGRAVSLLDGAGAPAVLLSHPGRFVLALDIAAPLTAASGSESLTLPPSSSALSRAALVLPRNGVELTLTGGILLEKTESAQEIRFLAHGRPSESLRFTWRRKVDDHRATLPLRLRGSVTSLVGLGEDSAQLSAQVRLEVLQGAARHVSVALPEGVAVNQVTGALVADWEVQKLVLVVQLVEPVERETTFLVTAEMPSPREGKVQVPLLRLPAAERETGGVAVEVLGAGEVTNREGRGLDAADAQDLGEPVAGRDSPSLVAFRYRPQEGQAARGLEVAVIRYTPQAVLVANVEEARYETLLTEDGKALVRARYAVRNNQRSFLAVTLPEGSTLWSAAVGGRPVRPGRSPEGALLLPLQKGRAGEEAPAFAAEVVYFQRGTAWTDRGKVALPLPALDLPVSRTGVEVRYSPRFRLTPEAGAFREEPYEGARLESLENTEVTRPAEDEADRRQAGAALQGLIDQLSKDTRGRVVTGVLPLRVSFPGVGSLLYLTAELTAESQAPVVALAFRRGGVR